MSQNPYQSPPELAEEAVETSQSNPHEYWLFLVLIVAAAFFWAATRLIEASFR